MTTYTISAFIFRAIPAACLLTILAATAAAQAPQFAYRYKTEVNTSLIDVPVSGTIGFPDVDLGQTTVVTFIAENRGPTPWTITKLTLSGAAYTFESARDQLVNPLSSVPVTIRFRPTTVGRIPSQFTFELTNQSGTVNTAVQVNFQLEGRGVAPIFLTSYIPQPSGNQTLLEGNSTLPFLPTAVESTAVTSFIVQNTGTGPGTLRSVSVTGEAFTISGLPLLPTVIRPDANVRFNLNFRPTQRGPHQGSLILEYEGADRRVIPLQGEGVTAALTYEWRTGNNPLAVIQPAGTITIPPGIPGEPITVTMAIRNTGNSRGEVRTISLAGAGYSLTAPPLPATLAAGDAVTFTFTFTPRDANPVEATLRIDAATFRVLGSGLGARLSFRAMVGQVATPIAAGGTYTFPNTMVGGQSQIVTIQVRNEGNQPATVGGISVVPVAFTIQALPALPATVAPNGTIEIPMVFSPLNLGATSGTLQIDDTTLNLRGIGDNPPALPAVTFLGVGERANPLEQPSIGLQLQEIYPFDLTGTLTLSVVPASFTDDPAIQFAIGGRTIPFRIPARSRQAVFGAVGQQVPFQTGTVAGDINFEAVFQVGQLRLGSADQPVRKSVTIPPGPPQLRNVRVESIAGNSFQVLITGYAASRSITQASFQFTATPGAQLQTTAIETSVEAPFSSWYQSAPSRSFGSQFTAAVTISVTGDSADVQSVAVRLSNGLGASETVTANLR